MTPTTETNTLQPVTASRVLPRTLHAITGRECNLWFNSLPLPASPDLCNIRVKCDHGRHLARRWTWIPGEPGSHSFSLSVNNPATGYSLHEEMTIQAHPPSRPGRSIRYLPIGDSITSAAHYLSAVRTLLRDSDINATLLGTQHAPEDDTIRHEGYPGWKFSDFLHQEQTRISANERKKAPSPFHFGNTLSFQDYRDKISGSPDVITVLLGNNDVALIDDGFESHIREIVLNAKTLLESLASGFPNARIGVILPPPPAPTQDAFGNNYGCLIPRWLYLRNVYCFREEMTRLLEVLPGQIECIPVHLQFDAETAYPLETKSSHALSSKMESVFCNALHPTPEGHSQIAESLFAWMTAIH